MGHELVPRDEIRLPAASVADLLATAFAYVKSSAEEGTREALSRAEWMERAPAKIFLGRHAEALEVAARLRTLSPGDALVIIFGDDENHTMRIVVIPGEPIRFGYASSSEQRASGDLVQRCAHALNCEVVEF